MRHINKLSMDCGAPVQPASNRPLCFDKIKLKNKSADAEDNSKIMEEEDEILMKKGLCSLSDVGCYSYISFCACCLKELFAHVPSTFNSQAECQIDEFSMMCIESIGKHLKQPKQVVQSAQKLVEDEYCNPAAFKEILLKESLLSENIARLPKDLVLVAISQGAYDSRMRVLIRCVAEEFSVSWTKITTFEQFILQFLHEDPHEQTCDEKKQLGHKEKQRKLKKYALIGLASIGSGALLGLTGGLAAPFLAAGVGTVLGGAGVALGTSAGVAAIGSLFGIAGVGLGGYKMSKRVGDIEEFQFEPISDRNDMSITIAVTGWLSEQQADFCVPWHRMRNSLEQYSLRYESQYLIQMGDSMDYICNIAVNAATAEALKYTVISGLLSAIAWPATILSASSIIDNPWSVCTHRTSAVGKHLADVLLQRKQGKRPVTLVGYSLGARVIFYCLQELAKSPKGLGLIENAILLGAPVTGQAQDWLNILKIVPGKLINGFCRHDWLLKFLYRTVSIQYRIAGLQPVDIQDRRMQNLDLSNTIQGHLDYAEKLTDILSLIGVETASTSWNGQWASECHEVHENFHLDQDSD